MREKSKILIQEPPMRELNKKGSCAKQSCISGCGCLSFFIIFTLLFLRLFVLSYPKTVKNIPQNVIQTIPIYNQESIEKIKVISGEKRADMLNKAAFIPKVLLSPILFGYELYANKTNNTDSNNLTLTKHDAWNAFVEALNTSIVDKRDTIQILWDDEKASPEFILEFYTKQLQKNGFSIITDTSSKNSKKTNITFIKDQITGSLSIKQDINSQGTDNIILTVSLPN